MANAAERERQSQKETERLCDGDSGSQKKRQRECARETEIGGKRDRASVRERQRLCEWEEWLDGDKDGAIPARITEREATTPTENRDRRGASERCGQR